MKVVEVGAAAPAVTATLTLGAQTTNLILSGPAILPASIPNGFGVVQHSFTNSFTNTIPKAWAKSGLTTWAQDLGDIQTPAARVAVTVSSVFLTQPRLYIQMRADRQSHPMPHPKILFNP